MRRLLLAGLCCFGWACGPTPPGTDGGTGDGGAGCFETGKSPANLVPNPGFECGGADTQPEWVAIYGSLSFPSADAHTGDRAAKLTTSTTGAGRFALAPDLVSNGGSTTYCVAAWAKGTAPYMRIRVIQDGVPGGTPMVREFNAPVPTTWERVPPSINLDVPNGSAAKLLLVFELQSNRTDGQNAKPGDVLFIDDVDAWASPDGRCRETR